MNFYSTKIMLFSAMLYLFLNGCVDKEQQLIDEHKKSVELEAAQKYFDDKKQEENKKSSMVAYLDKKNKYLLSTEGMAKADKAAILENAIDKELRDYRAKKKEEDKQNGLKENSLRFISLPLELSKKSRKLDELKNEFQLEAYTPPLSEKSLPTGTAEVGKIYTYHFLENLKTHL